MFGLSTTLHLEYFHDLPFTVFFATQLQVQFEEEIISEKLHD